MNHSKTGASLPSTTRLSASAKPFTLNRSTQHPISIFIVHSEQEPALYSPDHRSSDPFGSLLNSFPKFSSGAKGSPLSESGIAHEAVASTFPNERVSLTQADKESLSQHPSMDSEGNDNFIVLKGSDFDMPKEFSLPLPVYCPDITDLCSGTCTGYELNHGKQEKYCHDGLLVAGKDDRGSAPRGSVRREGKMQGGAKLSSVLRSNSDDYPFIFSTSDGSSSAKLNDISLGQGCQTPHGETRNAFISSGAPDWQYFSEVPSSTSNIACDSMGSPPAEIHGSSSHCSVLLPFDSARNLDLLTGGWETVDYKDCSSSIVSCEMDSFVNEGKGTDVGDMEKPKKIGKSVTLDARDHSTITTNQVMLKSDDPCGCVSIQTSKNLGNNDSDLDSPCWKGKMTSQSPSESLGSVHTHGFEKELKKCNTLNPLAPQFFPKNAEGRSHCIGKKVKDDFASSESSAPLAVNLLPGQNKQMKTVMVGANPVELKGVELLHSNNMNESVKAFNLVSDPKCSVLPNSTCMTQPNQPVSVENFSTKEKTMAAGNVDGFSKETKDDMTKGSIGGSFPVKYHSPTPSSSSPQAGLSTNLFETLQGVSKSSIDTPNVQTMVNAMLILSELLVQSRVHTLGAYKQHDHDTIQHIINNLNEFCAIYSGQMVSAVQSTQTGNPDLLGTSLDLPKHSRKGMEEASVEAFTIPKKLHNQNDNGGQNNVSKVIAERGQYQATSSSDVGPEKGNEIFQVITRNLGKNLDIEEHLHPQGLLYKNLWLDAEAALCHMRRKMYLRLMETRMDVNHSDLVDLWR